MWSQYYQPNVSQLLRKSILSLCSENVPYEDKLEVDGIICISKGTEGDHIVVKLHEVLDNIRKDSWKCLPDDRYQPTDGPVIKTEVDEEEIFTIVQDESPMDCRLPTTVNSRGAHSNAGNTDDSDLIKSGVPQASGEEAMDGLHFDRPAPQHVLPNLDILSSDSYEENLTENNTSSDPNSDGQPGEFVCRECGSQFGNFSSLSAHAYDIHGRFTCKQCLNTFSMLCNLKRHERLHAGRKPYNCATCGKGFSRNSDRRLHIAKRHKTHSERTDADSLNSSVPHTDKASHLCDILTRLTQKNAISVQKKEGRTHRKKHSTLKHSENSVIDLSSDAENSSGDDKTSDAENQNERRNSVEDIHRLDVKLESEGCLDENIETRVPVPMPLFTRSILRSGGKHSRATADQPKIIHIIPNNNSSGGHMEEASDANNSYSSSSSYLQPGSLSDNSSLNTIHGLSFGRIVFPGQTDPQDHLESPMTPPYKGATRKDKELPFRTYLGSNSEDHKTTDSGEDRAQSSSPSTYQPASPCYGSSSRSNSPVVLPRDDQDIPTLISLDREYWCRACKTQWNNFRTYEQHHVNQHLRYPCQFCDQTFSNKNNRSRHIRSHTGQREHTCPECGKSFSRSDTLKEHQIIHTDGYLGDKCNYCQVVIKRKAELLGHIKKCSQRQKHRQAEAASPTAGSE